MFASSLTIGRDVILTIRSLCGGKVPFWKARGLPKVGKILDTTPRRSECDGLGSIANKTRASLPRPGYLFPGRAQGIVGKQHDENDAGKSEQMLGESSIGERTIHEVHARLSEQAKDQQGTQDHPKQNA